MQKTTKKTLALIAHPNWRGVSTDRLVYMIQDAKWRVELLTIDPRCLPPVDAELKIPIGLSEEEEAEQYRFFYEQLLQGIEEEIQRRRKLQYEGIAYTNKEIIQTIKNALSIEDVLGWYTEVFLHKKVWTYRCTLHGVDTHPSGVIYREESRCWCFVCSRGGDIFDMVQLFERLELPATIAKLARHLGLDTKPLVRVKTPKLLKRQVGVKVD